MAVVSLCVSSCTTADERASALRTVAEADSLDKRGVLYADTVLLRSAADVLSPYFHRTEKAKRCIILAGTILS
ncbi:MAG: hypothetical protein IJ776_06460 [Paludibacteraceae bacterium]|nr:hypothetical protein [Paludibacteraceae bacterium]